MCSESGHALSSTSTHAEQQSIAERLSDDTTDATQMLEGIHEQYKIHLRHVDLVVILQVVLYNIRHLKTFNQVVESVLNTVK